MGRKLGRLLGQAGFTVQKMTASYEAITESVREMAPSLAGLFAGPGDGGIAYDKSGDESLFVALAWCETVGCAT